MQQQQKHFKQSQMCNETNFSAILTISEAAQDHSPEENTKLKRLNYKDNTKPAAAGL